MNSIELRRYLMQPGRRDDLIEIFEREFIEGQEACGMTPIGHFRDHAHPDTYVWLRGFPDAQARKPALEAFYVNSPVWKANRDAANATMIDSDDVLMLRPLLATSGIDVSGLVRPSASDAATPDSVVVTAIYSLDGALPAAAADAIEREVVPGLERCAQRVAVLVTDEYPNEFPRLPVRDGHRLVIFGSAAFSNEDEFERKLQPHNLPASIASHITAAEFLHLEPAARSLYR
jgi:hypothetical protein